MSMSIGGIAAGCSAATQNASVGPRRREAMDVSKMVEEAFSKIDTKQQGYIDEAALESALSNVSGAGNGNASAVMKALDGDSDGKITKTEMSDGLQRLADQFESRFNEMRTRQGQTEGNPPPPPPGGQMPPPPDMQGAGLTRDDLTAMAQSAGTDSEAASDLNSLLASFDEADTDADGKVSFKEAQAFRESQEGASGSSSSGEVHSRRERSAEAAVMSTIMRLVASYGTSEATQQQSSVAVTA